MNVTQLKKIIYFVPTLSLDFVLGMIQSIFLKIISLSHRFFYSKLKKVGRSVSPSILIYKRIYTFFETLH